MDRLTTDKPVKEMSMYELAHNSCFIKDGEAYYRDFDKEISARDLIRNTSQKVGHLEKGCAELIDDESFDATMIDDLQYDMTNYAGLIAVFYRNLWAMADLRETLKKYEDAEEQGLLLKLPCRIGDNVYRCSPHGAYIDICSITGFAECDSVKSICYTVYIDPDEVDVIALSEFGKTVFLTMEEAEKKQKELQLQ